jgi:hypothetical protein
MKLRRLNDEGLQKMGEFLDSLTSESRKLFPSALLNDDEFGTQVMPAVEVDSMLFMNRFAAGKYLNEIFGKAEIQDLERDRGIWAWLALFYFDQLCKIGPNGSRVLGERARWIPATGNFRKYYRHLLAGPYRIYRAHRDNPESVRALLCTPLNSPGEVAEQLASRQELVTNKAIMEAATTLYFEPNAGSIKRGAATRGPGSARRFADVLNQFDMTWDLYSMTAPSVLAMLPNEFERFATRQP